MNRRALVVNGALGIAGVGAGFALYHGVMPSPPGDAGTGAVSTAAGRPLPHVELPDRSGVLRPLESLGNALLVNFWATWCPPCRVEIPDLMAAAGRHPHLQVVGIALDQPAPVWRFVDRLNVNYPVLIEPGAATALHVAFGNPEGLLPHSVLALDGRMVAGHLGVLDAGTLDAWATLARG